MSNFLYDYWAIVDRPPLEWPEGKRLAFYVGLNIEHFEIGKPSTSISGLTASLPIDPLNAGWRDYGLRVGIWRMIDLLDRHELRASVLLNSDVPALYPQIIDAGNARDWVWLAHGKNNSSLWTGMELEEERSALATLIDELKRGTGKSPKGWLGPALTETACTCELLAEHGFTYTLDWCADDQPFPLKVKAGKFISVPYSIEVNDISFLLSIGGTGAEFGRLIIDQFDALYEESKRRPGAVASIGLHPFLVNQPFRNRYLDEALNHVRSHDDVWFTTSDDIADWYVDNYYDAAVEAQKQASR
jgi:peptidoglycan/xylan/chitin deacetylase (PgdA/CDA1 family)